MSIKEKLQEIAANEPRVYEAGRSVGLNRLRRVVDRTITEITEKDLGDIKTIGPYAFAGCSELRKVRLPHSVSTIKYDAFKECNERLRIYYNCSEAQWVGVTKEDENLANVDIRFTGHTVVDGVCTQCRATPWEPTAEYEGITYGVWASEEDYFTKQPPTQWYTDNLTSANIATTDNNGTTYADPDFIPGYVHVYTDITIANQIVTGQSQKLVINLGGHTVTGYAFRVGGASGSHADASLIVKNGNWNYTTGQNFVREDATFILENVHWTISHGNTGITQNNFFYTCNGDYVRFTNCTITAKHGYSFKLTASWADKGSARSQVIFENTDLIYEVAPEYIFVVQESAYGDCMWDVIFDTDSSIQIDQNAKWIVLREYHNASNSTVHGFSQLNTFTFEEGFTLSEDVKYPTTYDYIALNTDGTAKDTVERLANDDICKVTAPGVIMHEPGEAVEENRVEPTCTTPGSYEKVVYCSVCGEEISREKVSIPTLAHNYVDGVCSMCGNEYSESLKYTVIDDTTCRVSGIGTCTDTDIVIPSTAPDGRQVVEIGDRAFNNNTAITSVDIPDSVTSIGDYAFYRCTGLTSVTIGNSVTSIGDWAFNGCIGLTSITVDENNTIYKSIDGNLYTKDGKTLIQYAIGKEDTSFIIPDDVTSIGYSAFYNCSNKFTHISIPDGVESIGGFAFYSCDGLTSVTIPDSVTSIGNNAFIYCSGLTSVTIGNGVTSIGNYVFKYCPNITVYDFTTCPSVPTLGSDAIYGSANGYEIKVPASLVDDWKAATNWSAYADHVVGV